MSLVDEALKSIPVTDLADQYNLWSGISIAYARSGGTFDTWAAWCEQDPEKAKEITPERFNGFVRTGTEDPESATRKLLSWAARFGGFKHVPEPVKASPDDQAASFIKAVFGPDELVNIYPNGPFTAKQIRASELIDKLNFDSLSEALGGYDKARGVYVEINPASPGPRRKTGVTAFRHLLIESDDTPLEDQYGILLTSNLPITALVHSGNKSIHALVRVDAESIEEYAQAFEDVSAWLADHGLKADPACKDPSRLSRLPGVTRGASSQYLIGLNYGMKSYHDWVKTHLRPLSFYEESERGRPRLCLDKLCNWLMKVYQIRRVNGRVCFFDSEASIYRSDPGILYKAVRELLPGARRNVVTETESWITDMTYGTDQPGGDADYIAFKNCAVDLRTMKAVPKTKAMRLTSMVPWDYKKPTAETLAFCENCFMEWADNRPDLARLLGEIIGNCMESRIEEYQQAFILYGQKSTGKSVFLTLIETILGEDNFSGLSLQEVSERFKTLHLWGKKANIRNDIAQTDIKDASIFKQLVTGDTMTGEFKGKDAIKFKPYATQLFSCNSLPSIREDKGSIARRLCTIPFDRQFKPGAVDIKKELQRPEIIEGFIWLGVEGIQRARKQNGFTNPDCVRDLKKDYALMTQSVYAWCEELKEIHGITDAIGFLEHFRRSIYAANTGAWKAARTQYEFFCSEHSFEPYGERRYKAELEEYYSCKFQARTRRMGTSYIKDYVVSGYSPRM